MYLAAEGGELNGCDIQGQGMEFVKQVFFRAFRTYFDRSQNFATADDKLLQACNDLYTPQQCEELEKALQAVEADQPGRCSATPIRAPYCAVNHTGLAATTRSDQTPTTEFPVGWEVWLHFANATPNQTLDFQLLPHDPAREIWAETTSLALETASGTVLPDGSLSAPFFVPTLADTFDVLVDGNRDGHYQPWADTLMTITVVSATGTPDLPRPPTMLRSVRPNPTRSSARIAYTLQEAAQVDVAIYDVAGRLIRPLEGAFKDPGVYELTWDGTDASGRSTGTGLYFIKLVAGETVDTRKLVRVR
jgi:hypothetical protein